MAFWKKQSQIEEMVEQYLDQTRRCLAAFDDAFEAYFAKGIHPELEALVGAVRRHESAADAKRREVEQAMFRQALLPEDRGDILSLLEAIDEVPNEAEEVIRELWLQRIEVPQAYCERLHELVDVNVEANACLSDVVDRLFRDAGGVAAVADKVVEKEKAADVIEEDLIESIFASEIPLAQKLLLKHLVTDIADIADRAEDASDLIRILAVKQRA